MRILAMAMAGLLMAVPAAAKTPAKAPAQPTETDVNDCDRLAAHPGDPARITSGKDWDELDPIKAISACAAATRQWPGSARLAYEYGRALMKNSQHAEGLKR